MLTTAIALFVAHKAFTLALALASGCTVSALLNAPQGRYRRPLHPNIRNR